MEYWHHYASPLGGITLSGDGEALSGLWFDGQKYFPGFPERQYDGKDLPVFAEAERWLDCYFSGRAPDFTPRLALRGTPFRQSVWNVLLTVPYGQTVTYGELAERIATDLRLSRMSARAVGNAVGHNPVSLIVPCHRIVGAGGRLAGYAGGLERKRKLLEMESGHYQLYGRSEPE